MEVDNSVVLIRGSAVAFQQITDVQKKSDKESAKSAYLTKSQKRGTVKLFKSTKMLSCHAVFKRKRPAVTAIASCGLRPNRRSADSDCLINFIA